MKITFEFDLEKHEDQRAYNQLLAQNSSHVKPNFPYPDPDGIYAEQISYFNRTEEPSDKPPADLQIHTPTTDKINDRAEKGITVHTTPGNETIAIESLTGVMAEGETVQEVIVDEKPAEKPAEKTAEAIAEEVATKADAAEPKKPAKKESKKKEPVAAKPDKSESGKKLRLLMLQACKFPDVEIKDVNDAIFTACDVKALKDIKPEQADAAIAAVQALIDAKGGTA